MAEKKFIRPPADVELDFLAFCGKHKIPFAALGFLQVTGPGKATIYGLVANKFGLSDKDRDEWNTKFGDLFGEYVLHSGVGTPRET